MPRKKLNPVRRATGGAGFEEVAGQASSRKDNRKSEDRQADAIDAFMAIDRDYFAANPGRNYRVRFAHQLELEHHAELGDPFLSLGLMPICTVVCQVVPGVRMRHLFAEIRGRRVVDCSEAQARRIWEYLHGSAR